MNEQTSKDNPDIPLSSLLEETAVLQDSGRALFLGYLSAWCVGSLEAAMVVALIEGENVPS